MRFNLYLFILALICPLTQAKPIEISILKIADHPALDQTVKGIKDYFIKNQIEVKLNIESAQGQIINAKQIAAKFISKSPDLIIAIPTAAAQAFLKDQFKTKNKIIFSSVTDPKAAGLVSENHKTNFVGISNYVPVKTQLKYFTNLKPELKKLGTIYDPSQINSVKLLQELKTEAKNYNLEIVEATATKTTEIAQATQALIGKKTDAIFINNDNTALAAISTITGIAHKHKTPVYCSDIDTIASGVDAAIGTDQYDLGLQTAELAMRIYKNEELNTQIFYSRSVKAKNKRSE